LPWDPEGTTTRWYKLGKSSVYWAVQVNGSGVVQAVIECTAIPSETPSPSPSVTPSVTVTPSPVTLYTYLGRSTPDAANSTNACSSYLTVRGYLSLKSSLASIIVGDIFYDSYPGTPTNGGNNWIALKSGGVGDAYSFQINTDGSVTSVGGNCTPPTPTPSVTPTPSTTPATVYEHCLGYSVGDCCASQTDYTNNCSSPF
jgi:hypothetical protein